MSRGPSTVARTCVGLGLLVATACGVPTDDGAKSVEVPNDVFPAGFDVSDQPDSNLPNVTFHPVYFLRNGFLVQRDRPLPPPVLIKKPLDVLIDGPTDDEIASGLGTTIPAGTTIVNVTVGPTNVISIELNEAFFEVEGDRRISATAQLVYTAYGLARDTQGVRFFRDVNVPVPLLAGDGTIAEVGDDDDVPPLALADFSNLVPQPAIPPLPPIPDLTEGR